MNKYNEGDLVTIKLNKQQAYFWNEAGIKFEIVDHKPAPFDWSTAKTGMAFKASSGGRIEFFIGFEPFIKDYVVCLDRNNVFRIYHISTLTRAPEHDIEVVK